GGPETITGWKAHARGRGAVGEHHLVTRVESARDHVEPVAFGSQVTGPPPRADLQRAVRRALCFGAGHDAYRRGVVDVRLLLLVDGLPSDADRPVRAIEG